MAYVKPQQKANFFKLAALLGLCGFLGGCADNQIINDLTGEPAPGDMANRAGILRVDSREAVWPNLASVPPRPTDVPPQQQRDAERLTLEAQRQQGLALLPPTAAAPAAAKAAATSAP